MHDQAVLLHVDDGVTDLQEEANAVCDNRAFARRNTRERFLARVHLTMRCMDLASWWHVLDRLAGQLAFRVIPTLAGSGPRRLQKVGISAPVVRYWNGQGGPSQAFC